MDTLIALWVGLFVVVALALGVVYLIIGRVRWKREAEKLEQRLRGLGADVRERIDERRQK